MSCAPGLEYTYNAGVPDEAPLYTCCYCGGTFTASEDDIAAAYESAADDLGARGMALSDVVAFEDYGRDVCDDCRPKFKAEQAERRTPLTEREWILVQGAYATGRQDGQSGAAPRVDRLYQRAS